MQLTLPTDTTLEAGVLYVVSTPLGNRYDITLRALMILTKAEVVFCEDTRVGAKLFHLYGIPVPSLFSYFTGNEKKQSHKIIQFLQEGRGVVLISDAGTPGISDPGAKIISLCYQEGFSVVAIPGVSAVTMLYSLLGLEEGVFFFGGFLPKKEKERTLLLQRFPLHAPLLFYESPYRLNHTLEWMKTVYSPKTKIAIGRELTKKHEEIIFFSLEDVGKYTHRNWKGEITLALIPENTLKES